jgi:hypothetical protein
LSINNPCFIRVQSVAKKSIAPIASNARRLCQNHPRRRPSPGRVAASRQSAAFSPFILFSDGGFLPKAATGKISFNARPHPGLLPPPSLRCGATSRGEGENIGSLLVGGKPSG